MKLATAFACLVTLAAPHALAASDPMKAFPPAEPGQVRHVIAVPRLPVESDRRVELIVGKTVTTDAHNRYFFGGRLERETIKGWGFDRYVLKDLGPMAGTLMAVDPNAPKVERFVALGGEPRLLRYNSRLPIVVYVPEGVEVRYRIWRTDPDAVPAPKG
jgi:ecotin